MLTWTALEGSARGAAHEQTQLPNQDAVATRTLRHGRLVVAALADGHGGARYVRSDTGSRMAVDIACTLLVDRAGELTRGPITDQRAERLLQRLRTEIVPTIVSRWRERVAADVAARPFTDDERARAGSPLDDEPVLAYGATLLVAVTTEQLVALAQLGDGDILVVRRGEVLLPVERDERLVASQTTSLCLDSATDDFRCVLLTDVDGMELVLMSTDGYANSFADDDWEHIVGRDLVARREELGTDGIEEHLPEWLAASAAASGDDTSIALLLAETGTDDAPAGPGSGGGPGSEAEPEPAAAIDLRRALVFGAVALALGLVAGWLLGNATASPSGGRSRPPATTTGGGSAVGGPAVGRVTIVAGLGVAVSFRPDPLHPAPQRVATSSATAVTRLRLDTTVWSVSDDGTLTVTTPPGGPVAIPTGIKVAAITVSGASVWAVDARGSVLEPIDLATHKAGAPVAVTNPNVVSPTTANQNAQGD